MAEAVRTEGHDTEPAEICVWMLERSKKNVQQNDLFHDGVL